ncbi:MAG: SatD family protein [Balneolaceae bacterium]
MSSYIVIIADLVGSKDLTHSERSTCQVILENRLDQINEGAEYIISPATITLGDEFQAVYSKFRGLLTDCWTISRDLHPLKVRFSIGLGEIYTPINKEQTLGMDGPAFHVAREGIDQLKESGRLYTLKLADEPEPEMEKINRVNLANYTLRLLSGEMQKWRKTRLNILLKLIKNLPVKQIAGDLEISESAVYKNIHEGDLTLVMDLKESIENNMNPILEK